MSNIDITLKIEGLDGIASAIRVLASAIGIKNTTEQAVSAPVSVTPASAAQEQTAPQPAPVTATTQPAQVATPTLVAPATVAQNAVPTTAPGYTMDQLAIAAAPFMETAEGQANLQNLLAGYGVPSLAQLDKSLYGDFATNLRALGAQI